MTLRILYVSSEPVPGRQGGSVHTASVALGLAARGHAVTLICPPGEPGAQLPESPVLRLVHAPMRLLGRTAPILALPALLGLDPAGFDVVMARFSAIGGAEGIYARRAGLPLVIEVNSPQVGEICWREGWEGTLPETLLRGWEGIQFDRASAVVTPSVRIVPEAVRPRCRLVDWGCDPVRFAPARPDAREALRASLGLSGRFVAAFAGTFRPWHGADRLPALAGALRDALPSLVFLCMGGGDGLASVEAEAVRLGVSDRFRFTGPLPATEVARHLAAADLGLAPFRIRGYPPFERYGFFYSPLKIFEYMACGLPVLTTACPELQAIVREGVTGHCLPEDDVAAWAAVLVRLAADPGRRVAMGAAGRVDAAGRYAWAHHVEGLERVLEEAAGARRG